MSTMFKILLSIGILAASGGTALNLGCYFQRFHIWHPTFISLVSKHCNTIFFDVLKLSEYGLVPSENDNYSFRYEMQIIKSLEQWSNISKGLSIRFDPAANFTNRLFEAIYTTTFRYKFDEIDIVWNMKKKSEINFEAISLLTFIMTMRRGFYRDYKFRPKIGLSVRGMEQDGLKETVISNLYNVVDNLNIMPLDLDNSQLVHHSPWTLLDSQTPTILNTLLLWITYNHDSINTRIEKMGVTLPLYGFVKKCKSLKECVYNLQALPCDDGDDNHRLPVSPDCKVDWDNICLFEADNNTAILHRRHNRLTHNLEWIVYEKESDSQYLLSIDDEYSIAAKMRRLAAQNITNVNFYLNFSEQDLCLERNDFILTMARDSYYGKYVAGTTKDREYPIHGWERMIPFHIIKTE